MIANLKIVYECYDEKRNDEKRKNAKRNVKVEEYFKVRLWHDAKMMMMKNVE